MIVFNYESDFLLNNEDLLRDWLHEVIQKEDFHEGEINFIFCNDVQLLEKNIKYLKHNTLTDVIGFDYTLGKLVSGDIFISVERVRENADVFSDSFEDELHRVLVHGLLHFCGYKDKTSNEQEIMRKQEDYYLSLRTF